MIVLLNTMNFPFGITLMTLLSFVALLWIYGKIVSDIERRKNMKIKRRDNKQESRYNPKIATQSDIDKGLSKLFDDMNREKKGPQPLFSQQQRPQQSQQQKPFNFGQQPQQKQKPQLSIPIPEPEPEPEEPEPYWSAQEWEQWALDMYQQGAGRILPQWFLEALEA